jgi:hypothetical protein
MFVREQSRAQGLAPPCSRILYAQIRRVLYAHSDGRNRGGCDGRGRDTVVLSVTRTRCASLCRRAVVGILFLIAASTLGPGIAVAEPWSVTFYAPGSESWDFSTFLAVPKGVMSVSVTAVGAAGGSGCDPGGRGARVSATLTVLPGQELRGEVGEVGEASEAVEGQPPCPGGTGHGWYDGGSGGKGSGGGGGGGSSGGGASWVAVLPERFPCCTFQGPWGEGELRLVAGGGGGGGFGADAAGGDAGAVGQAGHAAAGLGAGGGGGGTASGGGTAGAGARGSECRGTGGDGLSGRLQHGGGGGNGESGEFGGFYPELPPAGGGGGGGGYFGGAGGGGGARYESFQPEAQSCLGSGGGGGGSSFVASGAPIAEPTSELARVTIAYEPFPPPLANISVPAAYAVYEQGQVVKASYGCTETPGGPGIVSCQATCWHFVAGAFVTVSITDGSNLPTDALGTYNCGVEARSQDALEASARHGYTVVPRGSIATSQSGHTSSVRPVLTRISQTHTRWREGNRLPALESRRRPPVGTVFSFTLNEAASVRLSFRRNGSHGKQQSITVRAARGRTALRFDGRLSRRRPLSPGAYAMGLVAVNGRHQSSLPHVLRFVIVR